MNFKALYCAALLALVSAPLSPSASAQTAKPAIPVPPADTAVQITVAHFVDHQKANSGNDKCQQLLSHPSGNVRDVSDIRSYRACKAERILNSMQSKKEFADLL